MPIQWSSFRLPVRYISLVILKTYTISLGIFLYKLKRLSATSDAFDYTKHDTIFLLFALLAIPQSVGVIMSVLLIVGVLKKRSELMLPSIVYNWILICLCVIIVFVYVIYTQQARHLQLLLGPVLFALPCWCIVPCYFILRNKNYERMEDINVAVI